MCSKLTTWKVLVTLLEMCQSLDPGLWRKRRDRLHDIGKGSTRLVFTGPVVRLSLTVGL